MNNKSLLWIAVITFFVTFGSPSLYADVPTATTIEFEPNNTQEESNSFLLTDTMTGLLSTESDVDFFSFTLSSSTNIDFNFYNPSSTADFYVDLLNNQGNLITRMESLDGKTGRILTKLEMGDYFLSVSRASGWEANTFYVFQTLTQPDLTIEEEPNDSIIVGNAIELDSSRQGVLSFLDERDYFLFSLSESQGVNIALEQNLEDITTTLYKIIQDPRLGTPSNQFKMVPHDSVLNRVVSYAELQIVLEGININNEIEATIPEWNSNYDCMFVSSFDSNPLKSFLYMGLSGGTGCLFQEVSILSPIQLDFNQDLPSGTIIDLNINEGVTSEGQIITDISELMVGGDIQFIDDFITTSTQSNQKEIGLEAGDYAIVLRGKSAYNLSLTRVDRDDIDNSDSFDTAIALNLNNPKSNNLFSKIDEDFYHLSLEKPRQLEIQFSTNQNIGDYKIELFYISEENLIDSFTSFNGNSYSTRLGLAAGDYYFKVSTQSDGSHSATEFYSLLVTENTNEIYEIESNNTPHVAMALPSQTLINGRLYSSEDVDYYAFTQTTQGLATIHFETQTSTSDFKVSLLNASETSLSSYPIENGQSLDIPVGIRQGVHYLKIENNGDHDASTEYSLSISGSLEPLRSLVSLNLSGNNTLNTGELLNLSTTANFSDATTENITSFASYSSSDSKTATVNAQGTVEALKTGNVTIFATYGGKMAKKELSIDDATEVSQTYGNLILVAGGGIAESNKLREATQYLSNLVYQTFKKRGFDDEDIYYFNPHEEHDLNGDGFFDPIVDSTIITLGSFEDALIDWASHQSSSGPLYLYLIDHGGIDKFELFPGNALTASMLDQYLTAFQTKTGREVVILIEACKSGSFIDDLAHEKRILFTSTDFNDAYISTSGKLSFTQPLLNRLLEGGSLQEAFTHAQAELLTYGRPYNRQKPQISIGNTGTFAFRSLGGEFSIAGLMPEILDNTQSQTINAGETLDLFIEIDTLDVLKEVYAFITPPDYAPPAIVDDLTAPEVTLPRVDLIDEDSSNILDGRYEGNFSDFIYNGIHRIVFYAHDENNALVSSTPIEIEVQHGQDLSSQIETSSNWELMGLPFQLSSNDPSVLLDTQSHKILAIWAWEQNSWAIWSPTQNTAAAYNYTYGTDFSDLSNIKNTKGYWVNLKEGESWNFNGTLASVTPSLAQGWNLVTFQSGTLESILGSLSGHIHSIWSWEGAAWKVYAPNNPNHQFANFPILTNLEVGKGYWVRVQ